jgi:hypothetical protein
MRDKTFPVAVRISPSDTDFNKREFEYNTDKQRYLNLVNKRASVEENLALADKHLFTIPL